MKPDFPIIVFYEEVIDLISAEKKLFNATILAVLKCSLNVVYDSNFNIWKYELKSERIKNNLFTKFLSNTLYNPIIPVKPIWTFIESSNIQSLKNKINVAIDKDDDILTQFVQADKLKKQISNTNSFKNIYQVLLNNVFEYNE